MPQICDMGQMALLPFWRKACWGIFCPKNPTASAGSEPAILGTRGQHANHYTTEAAWVLSNQTYYVYRVPPDLLLGLRFTPRPLTLDHLLCSFQSLLYVTIPKIQFVILYQAFAVFCVMLYTLLPPNSGTINYLHKLWARMAQDTKHKNHNSQLWVFRCQLKVHSHLEIPYKHHVTTDPSHRCECLHVTIPATTFPTSLDNRQSIQSEHRTSWCAPANWDISCAHHKNRPLFTMCAQMNLRFQEFVGFLTHDTKLYTYVSECGDVILN
jgi:hypothetical protein